MAGAGVEWTAKPLALDCKFRWSVLLRVGSWLGSLCDLVPTQLDSNRKIDGPREKFTVHSAPARQPAKSLHNGYHACASPSENPQNSFSAHQNYIHRVPALEFNRGRHSAFTRGQPLALVPQAVPAAYITIIRNGKYAVDKSYFVSACKI